MELHGGRCCGSARLDLSKEEKKENKVEKRKEYKSFKARRTYLHRGSFKGKEDAQPDHTPPFAEPHGTGDFLSALSPLVELWQMRS